MKMIFANTFYWAALLNPRDQWHQNAKDVQEKLKGVRLVTTETVLIELLNYFSEYGAEMRQIVVDTSRDILVIWKSNTFHIRRKSFLKHWIFTKSVWIKVTV